MSEVILATRDADVCLVQRRHALAVAQRIADELNQTITVRNPVTDKVLGKVKRATGGDGVIGRLQPGQVTVG
jgi:hypothetical protein